MTSITRRASVVLPFLLLMGLPVWADDVDIRVGTAPLCDTQQQVERFVEVFDGDTEVAINAVNAEADDPTACVLATMAYVPEPPLATIQTSASTAFQIAAVRVLGVLTVEGVQEIEPNRFFSAFQVDRLEL